MRRKRIVWDEIKIKLNKAKHKVSFEDAATIFFDKWALTVEDPERSFYEFSFVTIGETNTRKVVKVFYTETEEEIRIISARKPNKRERFQYEEEH